MKVVFATSTPLAGMPWRTAKVMNRFLRDEGGWARCVVDRPSYGDGRDFPVDLKSGTPEANKILSECDLIIVSAYMRDNTMGLSRHGKPIARHYSTEPFRWVDKHPDPACSTVVAQYQWRHAQHLTPLPNCIPIDDPIFQPDEKPSDRLVVVYTPTSRRSSGWANKGYGDTVKALRQLQRDAPTPVEVLVLERQPYLDVMRARRHAHIVIDECATGSYHGTALEGLSTGCVSICWIDPYTRRALEELYGGGAEIALNPLPFFISTLRELGDNLMTLASNPDLVRSMGQESRTWMEMHYSESWQAKTWIAWHEAFLATSLAKH